MIPQKELEELRKLLERDGITPTDEALYEAGVWLLARARSVPYEIPVGKEALWEKMAREEKHPHGR